MPARAKQTFFFPYRPNRKLMKIAGADQREAAITPFYTLLSGFAFDVRRAPASG
jgi:hypothetical protein